MGDARTILEHCLYFTAGALARRLTAMAEDCFRPTGLNPSQGFALMCIVDEPGISPSVIAERLALAPSTVTRIVAALERAGHVTTTATGRRVAARPTPSGRRLHKRVLTAWRVLYDRYSDILGENPGIDLCRRIHEAAETLGAERSGGSPGG